MSLFSLFVFQQAFIQQGFPALGREKGFTLMELLVAIAIFGLLAAIAIPNLRSNVLNLSTAFQDLGNNLRLARANATSRGAHFQVTVEADAYVIQRLSDPNNDNVWTPDPTFPESRTELPDGVTVTAGTGSVIEFNTRGLVSPVPAGPPQPITTITLSDSTKTKTLSVWPSGQIQEM